jgi:hypothetical protein
VAKRIARSIFFEKQHADSDRNQGEENRKIIKIEPECA